MKKLYASKIFVCFFSSLMLGLMETYLKGPYYHQHLSAKRLTHSVSCIYKWKYLRYALPFNVLICLMEDDEMKSLFF